MKHLFSISLCVALLVVQISAALAQREPPPVYTISEKSLKSGQSGQIHGLLRYCVFDEKNPTEIYIPGTSFRAIANNQPDPNTYGDFNIYYVPAGIYSLVFDFPGNDETADYQIDDVEVRDGLITEFGYLRICRDQDNDGYYENRDCRDDDPAVNPNAIESCSDRIDNNCDGVVNEECHPCLDADQDGFLAGGGIQGDGTILLCSGLRDCNDNNPLVRPIEAEVCDSMDNNCDGRIDEGFDLNTDLNCGSCGVVCNYPDTCVAGVCSNQ